MVCQLNLYKRVLCCTINHGLYVTVSCVELTIISFYWFCKLEYLAYFQSKVDFSTICQLPGVHVNGCRSQSFAILSTSGCCLTGALLCIGICVLTVSGSTIETTQGVIEI